MNRRKALRVLPIAAVTATAMNILDLPVQAHELKPEKKYLIVIANNDLRPEDANAFAKNLHQVLGVQCVVVAGSGAEDLKLYELQ